MQAFLLLSQWMLKQFRFILLLSLFCQHPLCIWHSTLCTWSDASDSRMTGIKAWCSVWLANLGGSTWSSHVWAANCGSLARCMRGLPWTMFWSMGRPLVHPAQSIMVDCSPVTACGAWLNQKGRGGDWIKDREMTIIYVTLYCVCTCSSYFLLVN